ncbi:hypothetical protein MLD38_015300 [Melastoma candidum]|uniref:Uncharacterized protein n=1 Tax=Melastoma candidum TaxID=119954 RepID=A0ACB9RFH0_9MYRT|nr:hypothetical protein MLD38_015300 [Melastoma candidum]
MLWLQLPLIPTVCCAFTSPPATSPPPPRPSPDPGWCPNDGPKPARFFKRTLRLVNGNPRGVWGGEPRSLEDSLLCGRINAVLRRGFFCIIQKPGSALWNCASGNFPYRQLSYFDNVYTRGKLQLDIIVRYELAHPSTSLPFPEYALVA